MLRRQIYLTPQETKELKSFAKDLGISTSEYIRRVLDDHIENKRAGCLKNDPTTLVDVSGKRLKK